MPGTAAEQLKFTALGYDVGEVEQVHFERVQHALACVDDLLRLLFDWQRTNQGCHFFRSFPLRQLPKTLLSGPDARMNDLEEELTRPRIEDEDCAVCCAKVSRWQVWGGARDAY